MKLEAVIDVTSYEVTARKLMEFIKVPDGCKAVPLPCATPDGLPNHLQILVVKRETKDFETLRKCAAMLQ